METLKIQIPEGFKVESFDLQTGEIKLTPKPTDIREVVKTFEDAFKLLKSEDQEIINFKKLENAGIKGHILENQKLIIIAKALNEGWVPDWSNGEWDIWFPWFNMDDEGSSGRFSFFRSDDRRSASYVGSRLCFKSSDLAEYAAKQFISLYKKVFTI